MIHLFPPADILVNSQTSTSSSSSSFIFFRRPARFRLLPAHPRDQRLGHHHKEHQRRQFSHLHHRRRRRGSRHERRRGSAQQRFRFSRWRSRQRRRRRRRRKWTRRRCCVRARVFSPRGHRRSFIIFVGGGDGPFGGVGSRRRCHSLNAASHPHWDSLYRLSEIGYGAARY